jgi:hypothetical protein
MANSNHLKGLRCPQCGSYEPLSIAIDGCIKMYDDGSSEDCHWDLTWTNESYCECGACHWGGLLKEFADPDHRPDDLSGEHPQGSVLLLPC